MKRDRVRVTRLKKVRSRNDRKGNIEEATKTKVKVRRIFYNLILHEHGLRRTSGNDERNEYWLQC